MRGRFSGLFVSLSFLVAAIGVVLCRQQLVDWWQLHNYTPPTEVKQLADQGQVTDYARRVFYVTHPAVEDSNTFNQHCNQNAERTIVLGCYNGRYTYIYNVTDTRLDGVKQVTAMHEMLHAAYDRLSSGDKAKINGQLEAQLASLHDNHINELVLQYQKSEPGELDNELHSILATEVSSLSPELETYYSKYFTNRKVVVQFANQYESVFTDSQRQIETADAKLASLKAEITDNQKSLEQEQRDLQAESARMNTLRQADDIEAYNAAVGPYNTRVSEYNAKIAATKELVAEYNDLVERRNQLATAHNDLAKSLNSNVTPLPAQ